jgi:hypothetical protein
MAVKVDKRLGPGQADSRAAAADASGSRGKDRRSAKADHAAPLGTDAMPARIGGKTKVVDKSQTTVATTDNSTNNITDKSRDKSKSVQTGDLAGAKTGDVSAHVPVSAVPGG